ncbi:MAG: NAD-dependent epimerase/dehydratase family protein [Patescibacteria group bacterium]
MTTKRIIQKLRLEFERSQDSPKPRPDWRIIWVLTGYDTSWDARSDTRRRVEEGMRLAKKISRVNGGKLPTIYVSGYDEHNSNLRKWRTEGLFEKKYSFPEANLIVGPLQNILHTWDQFKLFPHKFLKGNKKIIIVTDAYHIPRIERYVEKFFPAERERFIFYPAKPITINLAYIKSETKKIIKYSKKGIIPAIVESARKKVVVTGATGLLGTHFLKRVTQAKDSFVTVIGRDSFKSMERLREQLRGARFVYHLAGVNIAKDKKEYRFNATSTRLLLQAMKSAAPEAVFVCTSSFSVYRPLKRGQVVTEKSILKPRNAYGESKLAAERLIMDYSKRYGTSAVILRISNMYGPKRETTRAIIDQVQNAIKNNKVLTMNTSMEATRDFIYVDDVVAVLMKLLERQHKEGGVEIFNVCSGEETSITSLIQIAQEISRKRLRVKSTAGSGEPATFWKGSFQKAKKGLQWRPVVKLRHGLGKTLKQSQ